MGYKHGRTQTKQSTSETCGQACVAMITGKKIEEVIKDMKTSGPTSIEQLIEILDFVI